MTNILSNVKTRHFDFLSQSHSHDASSWRSCVLIALNGCFLDTIRGKIEKTNFAKRLKNIWGLFSLLRGGCFFRFKSMQIYCSWGDCKTVYVSGIIILHQQLTSASSWHKAKVCTRPKTSMTVFLTSMCTWAVISQPIMAILLLRVMSAPPMRISEHQSECFLSSDGCDARVHLSESSLHQSGALFFADMLASS